MKVQVTAIAFIGQILAALICGVEVVVISPEITVNLLLQIQRQPESAE